MAQPFSYEGLVNIWFLEYSVLMLLLLPLLLSLLSHRSLSTRLDHDVTSEHILPPLLILETNDWSGREREGGRCSERVWGTRVISGVIGSRSLLVNKFAK